MRRKLLVIAVSVGIATMLLGCSAEEGGPPPTQVPTTVTATSTSPATTTVAGPGQSTVGPTPPADLPVCSEVQGWNTKSQEGSGSNAEDLYLVRVGKQDCYDRVVFDINGPGDVGFHVGYVPIAREGGSGKPVPVEGGAVLQVSIHAPLQGYGNSGHQPGKVLAQPRGYLYTPDQLAKQGKWRSLRAVRFLVVFENASTIAVGVREELPLRVWVWPDDGQTAHVVVDIAHSS